MKAKSIVNIVLISFAIIMIFAITFFDIRNAVRQIAVIFYMIVFSYQKVNMKIALLFFITTFTADLGVSFGVPAISLLQAILLIDILIVKKYIINNNLMGIFCALLAVQFCSIMVAKQTIAHIIVFAANILIFLSVAEVSRRNKEDRQMIDRCLWLFLIGLTIVLICGLKRDTERLSWERYQGLWTDPNFLGLFCVLGISIALSMIEKEKKSAIVCIPIIALAAYSGYLTASRTFIIALGIIVLVAALGILKSSNSRLFTKVLLISIIIFAGVYFYNNYIVDVINQRGLVSESGRDWSNGRVDDINIIYNNWKNNFGAMCFGFGYSNVATITGYVAHNTYLDFVFEFGFIGAVLWVILFVIFFYISKVKIKDLLSLRGIILVSIMLYAGTLSMLNTDALYLFLGLTPYMANTLYKEKKHEK